MTSHVTENCHARMNEAEPDAVEHDDGSVGMSSSTTRRASTPPPPPDAPTNDNDTDETIAAATDGGLSSDETSIATPPTTAATDDDLAVITSYYNFDRNEWMCENIAHAIRSWKQDSRVRTVIVVELALDDDAFELTREHAGCDVLIQLKVRDVMSYRETALNIAYRHMVHTREHDNARYNYVAWIDNDCYFMEDDARTWATDAIGELKAIPPTHGAMGTALHLCSTVHLTSEGARADILNDAIATDREYVRRHTIARHSIYYNRDEWCRSVVGTAWIARFARTIDAPFFPHAYAGGGAELNWWLWQQGSASLMRGARLPTGASGLFHYMNPQSGFEKVIRNYVRKSGRFATRRRGNNKTTTSPLVIMNIAQSARPMVHLFHGVPDGDTTAIMKLLHTRRINIDTHVSYGKLSDPLLPVWTESVRMTKLNDSIFKAMARCKCSTREQLNLEADMLRTVGAVCNAVRTTLQEVIETVERSKDAQLRLSRELHSDIQVAYEHTTDFAHRYERKTQ